MASIELKWSTYAKDKGYSGYYFILKSNADASDNELLSSTPFKVFDDLNVNSFIDTEVDEGANYKYCIGTVVGSAVKYGRVVNARVYRENTTNTFGARLMYGDTVNGIGDTLTSAELEVFNSIYDVVGLRGQGFFSNDYHYIYIDTGSGNVSQSQDEWSLFSSKTDIVLNAPNGLSYKTVFETPEDTATQTRGLRYIDRTIEYFDAVQVDNVFTSEVLELSYNHLGEDYSYNTPSILTLKTGVSTHVSRDDSDSNSIQFGYLLKSTTVV